MIIPWQELIQIPSTTCSSISSCKKATEYGEQDVSLADKVEEVRQQLQQGSAVLVYSELHESVNVVPKTHLSNGARRRLPARMTQDLDGLKNLRPFFPVPGGAIHVPAECGAHPGLTRFTRAAIPRQKSGTPMRQPLESDGRIARREGALDRTLGQPL